MRTCWLGFLLALGLVQLSNAMPTVVDKEDKLIYSSVPCEGRIGCVERSGLPRVLKEFGFWSQEYHIPKDPKLTYDYTVYNTKLIAWYHVLVPSVVEDYAFVQYIRGCVFTSFLDKEGKVETHLSITRQHRGERHVFVHPDWEIDSDIEDPLYGASGSRPLRHYFMQWNTTPDIFPEENGKFYGEDPPHKTTRLFVSTLPWPPAYIDADGVALNRSLEYRTCLYRTSDVPLTADEHMIPGAISCHDWRVSNIYDFDKKVFVSQPEIATACRVPKKPDPNKPW